MTTTNVHETPQIKKLHFYFDKLLKHAPSTKYFALTNEQYTHYVAQIRDRQHVGNPRYMGIEIKKTGED